MKKLKLLWDLLPAMVLWLMLSVFLWGWIFTFLTDTKPENKLTLFADTAVTDATGLAVRLEETLKDGPIRMVKVHPFTYAMLSSEALRGADVYLVRASHVQEYREWFAPLPEGFAAAQQAQPDALLTADGTTAGLRVYDAAQKTGPAGAYIAYQDASQPEEDFYLFFGNGSTHLDDGLALRLAEQLLLIE